MDKMENKGMNEWLPSTDLGYSSLYIRVGANRKYRNFENPGHAGISWESPV
jgi:hypothetical protein